MAKRSTARKIAMQTLYQIDIAKIPFDEAFQNVISEEKFSDETINYAKKLVKSTLDNIDAIDNKIKIASKNWALNRMGFVDRNILRLAVCEIECLKENQIPVIINEAIELSKKFSGKDAQKFINGVLSFFASKKD